MNVLLVLIPVTALVVLVGVLLFFWAVNHQQFDDLDSPGMLPLMDDEPATVQPHASGVEIDEAVVGKATDATIDKMDTDPDHG